jgi:hypothetical protein
MATFHTEWNEEHRDWQCRSGIAQGVGATPAEAELACVRDIVENCYGDYPGWLGTPKPREADVHVTWEGPNCGWRAIFTDVMYRYASSGYGDTPDEATQDLMNRTVAY